jgi:hypothetical protein
LITWTMRLQGLRNELGGPRAHAREVARARYRPSSDQPLNAMALESAT